LSQNALYNTYLHATKVKQIVDALGTSVSELAEQTPLTKIQLKGLLGSSLSFVLQAVFKKSEKPFLLILNEKEEAAYILNDLEQMIGANDVLFYPSSYRRPYQIEETDNANV
jgi:transcription-repair coupling factor (superfamily II helicase)